MLQVSGWFDAFFGKIRLSSMELTSFEQNFVAVVVRYLTPMLLYLLYSRLTITTILLSFRRVKRQLQTSTDDAADMHSSALNGFYSALRLYWLHYSERCTAEQVLQGLVRSPKDSNLPALQKAIQEVYWKKSSKFSSGQFAKKSHQLLNLLIPPDVVRFVQTFHHGISASNSPLGRSAYPQLTVQNWFPGHDRGLSHGVCVQVVNSNQKALSRRAVRCS